MGAEFDGVERGGIGQWWAVEPKVGRLADGVADRVERLKALGNGQVPLVVAEAWLALIDGFIPSDLFKTIAENRTHV